MNKFTNYYCCVSLFLFSFCAIGLSTRAKAETYHQDPSLGVLTTRSKHVIIGKLQTAKKFNEAKKSSGYSHFIVEKILSKSREETFKVGSKIHLNFFTNGAKGDLFFIFAEDFKPLYWDYPKKVTSISKDYVKKLLSCRSNSIDQLKIEISNLESSDWRVAESAYWKLANTDYKDLIHLKENYPVEKVRRWVYGPNNIPEERNSLYGLILGLCGDETDAEKMRKIVTRDTNDFRNGIDGLIIGYLLLTGEKGLEEIVKTKVTTNSNVRPKPNSINETFAAIEALRFIWNSGSEKLSKTSLRKAMRILVDNEDFTPTAILTLARWKDWGLSDELIERYKKLTEDDRRVKIPIIAFFMMSAQDILQTEGDDEPEELPAHAVKAKEFLEMAKEKDPKDYKNAQQMYR